MSAPDSTKPEDKKKKIILSPFWILAIIAVGGTIALGQLYSYYSSQKSDSDQLQPQLYQCDRWKIEKDFLTNKYLLSNTKWSDEDKKQFEMLDGLVSKNCPTQGQKDLAKLIQLCTPMYITIQKQIDKMENRTLETLQPNDQKLYTNTYNEYFKNNCNNIQDEIVKQKSFTDFNKTRVT